MEEQQLIALFQAGDVKAQRILFDEFYKDLCYFTERFTGDQDEGQKVVIDAFEKLFRKHSHFQSLNNVKAFLYISCKNACLNFLKARKRKQKKEKEFISTQDDKLFVELEFVEAGVIKAIYTAIETLPDQCRRVFEMLYFEDMKYPEIAEVLGVTENTVRSQKRRAITLLRAKLNPSQFLFLVVLVYGNLLQYVLSSQVVAK